MAIAHNAKAFDLHLVLNRLVLLKSLPELLIMNSQKIIGLKVENVTWLDRLNYLALPLGKLPETFCLTAQRSWYPHLFNITKNMNYVGPALDVSHYGIDEMNEYESKEFVVVRGYREDGSIRQQASVGTLLPGPCDSAARSVPYLPRTLSTNRE